MQPRTPVESEARELKSELDENADTPLHVEEGAIPHRDLVRSRTA